MSDDYDTPGPGKRIANTVVITVLGLIALLILSHCAFHWPA